MISVGMGRPISWQIASLLLVEIASLLLVDIQNLSLSLR